MSQSRIAPVTVPVEREGIMDQNWKRWFLGVSTYDNNNNSVDYKADSNQGYSYQIPLTGFNVVIPDNCSDLILNPAGVLATGTINMPKTPINGQRVTIASTQTVTALTVNANTGQTIHGALTTIAGNGFATWRYLTLQANWIRVG